MVGQRGFAMVEAVIAIAIVGILAAAVSFGDAQELRFVGESFAETKADRLASGRIERLRSGDAVLEPGESDFDLSAEFIRGLPGARGHQHVRQVESGLYEVVIAISWLPVGATRRRVLELTTWLERGGR